MAATAQQLVDALSQHGLLHREELDKLAEHVKSSPDESGVEVAEQLLKRGLLTPYQVQVLVHDRADPLVLGNYTIHEEVGAGGMGRVFKAHHRRMDRLVALKVIKSDALRSPVAVQRFQQEVRTAARLVHPNIVTAYDADETNGVQYLVMEYVDGQDLGSVVRQFGPLSIDAAVNYVLQAAQGLSYAHEQGVVHRDIKPGNLLLDRNGVIKVLDMGLARYTAQLNRDEETDGRAELTATGMVFGTIDYISPEQAMSARRADARSDIYSLGCCLYYLLTGKAVFQGESLIAVLMMHRDATIPSLINLREDVPPRLDAIYKRMVAKDPDHRYASMKEVIHELNDLIRNTGLSKPHSMDFSVGPGGNRYVFARDSGTVALDRAQLGKLARRLRGKRMRFVGVAAAIGLLIAAGALLATKYWPSDGKRENPPQTRAMADLVEQVEPAVVRIQVNSGSLGSGFILEPDGLIVTNFHVISRAQSAQVVFADGAKVNVTGYRAVDETNDIALIKIDAGDRKLTTLNLANDVPRKGEQVLAFGAPQGFTGTASEGIVSSVRTGSEIHEVLANSGGDLSSSSYSPDSLWIQTTSPISRGNSGGPLVDLNGEVVGVNTWVVGTGQNLNFAVSAKNVQALVDQSRDTIKPLAQLQRASDTTRLQVDSSLTESKAPGEVHRFVDHTDEVLDVAVSRSGRFLASASKDHKILLYDLRNLSLIYPIKSPTSEFWCVAFSHDDSLLFAGSDATEPTANLTVFARSTGSKQLQLDGREVGTRGVSTSIDGRCLVTTHDTGLADLRYMSGVNSVQALVVHDRAEPCFDAVFSDDGRILATCGGDGFLYIWNIEDSPQSSNRMKVHDLAVRSVAISPDNKYLFSAADDKTIKVWWPWNATESWEMYKQMDQHEAAVTCLAVHKSGQWIASGSDDKTVRLWNFETNEMHVFRGHEGAITQVVFLPQGGLLASSSRDHTVRLWKLPFEDKTP